MAKASTAQAIEQHRQLAFSMFTKDVNRDPRLLEFFGPDLTLEVRHINNNMVMDATVMNELRRSFHGKYRCIDSNKSKYAWIPPSLGEGLLQGVN